MAPLHILSIWQPFKTLRSSENCLKIVEVCYLTLETSSKFATDKLYVTNAKAKYLLKGSCAITLDLLSLNTVTSKSYPKQKQSIKTSSNQTSIENINQKHQKHQVNVKIIQLLTTLSTKICVVTLTWQILRLKKKKISLSFLEY